jgi:hypothetical protein
MINHTRLENNLPFIESGKMCYSLKDGKIIRKENDQPYWAMQSLYEPVCVRYSKKPQHFIDQQMIPIRTSFEDNIQLLDTMTFNKLVKAYRFIREDARQKVTAQYGRNSVLFQTTGTDGIFEHSHIANTSDKTLTYVLDCTRNLDSKHIVFYKDDVGVDQQFMTNHPEFDLCCFTLDATKPHRTEGLGHGLLYFVFEEVETSLPYNYVERLHSPFI